MHESSLARGILRAVLEVADGPVARVRGWVSEDEELSAQALQMHFSALAQGSLAEDAQLELRITHIAAICACGERYLPEHHLLLCPSCGSTEATLEGDKGLGVEEIELS